MTKEEFTNLSAEEQECFIASGQKISVDGVGKEGLNGQHKSKSEEQTNAACVCNTAPSTGNNSQVESSPSPETQQLDSSSRGLSSSLPTADEGKESKNSPVVVNLDTKTVFDIRDPIELLMILDEDIRIGRVTLHDWQVQFLLDFANGGDSDKNPFQSVVRACNGSGKDKFLIAPAVVWLCMRYFRARGVVTSSSGVQLDNQTCSYIDLLAKSANRQFGNIWKCNYRYYECLASQSPIICYATDEPGKAEGFHPLEFQAKMAILVSEDKSVPDEINIALNKCTGYTHRVHVSTPGNAFGHFFDLCSTAVNRKDIKSVKDVRPEDYIEYHIRASDCPHLSQSYVKQMIRDLPGGENGAAYKSQVEAEFATTDEMVVVPYTYIWQAKKALTPLEMKDKWVPEEHNKAGLDLSDGGDETVLIVRNGNRVFDVVPFRFDNTEDTIEFLNEKFKEHKLVHKDALIFADCGGLGKPMLDRMRRQGWSNIRYIDNRSRSNRPKTYKNYGAELWFNFGNLLKQRELILVDDARLVRQLSTRYYKIIDGQIHQLLSKLEMRSRNYPSPDRADACVLAFADYKSNFVSAFDNQDKPFEIPEEEKEKETKGTFVLKSMAKGDDKRGKYRINEGQKDFSDVLDDIADYNRKLKTGV